VPRFPAAARSMRAWMRARPWPSRKSESQASNASVVRTVRTIRTVIHGSQSRQPWFTWGGRRAGERTREPLKGQVSKGRLLRTNAERSCSAIRIACVEIRTYGSRRRSQSPYTVAVETRSRAAASFTVRRRGPALRVSRSCITGALTSERNATNFSESIGCAGSGIPSPCEELPDSTTVD